MLAYVKYFQVVACHVKYTKGEILNLHAQKNRNHTFKNSCCSHVMRLSEKWKEQHETMMKLLYDVNKNSMINVLPKSEADFLKFRYRSNNCCDISE